MLVEYYKIEVKDKPFEFIKNLWDGMGQESLIIEDEGKHYQVLKIQSGNEYGEEITRVELRQIILEDPDNWEGVPP